MMWLHEVPMCVVNAHLSMLGRLQAEESRTAANVVGVGHAMKPGDWASRQLASWQSATRADGERASAGIPASAGIKVIQHGK